MATPTKVQINALMTFFIKCYVGKYGAAPKDFNRNREKWGFSDMIVDLSVSRAQDVIQYYFETSRFSHPVRHLLYNYDKFSQDMQDAIEDKIKLAELRAESKIRVEQWRADNGK